MTEREAFERFRDQAIGPVNESDFDWALRVTCDELMHDVPARGGRRKPSYPASVRDAAELLLTWYRDGAESVVRLDWADLAQSMCKRRPGAAWAIFLRKSHEGDAR